MKAKKQELIAQREAYGLNLVHMGAQYPNIVVLDADVSKSTRTEYFAQRYPDRFFNFGIAEQNMMGAAAGMAKCGLIPFVNSFSFLTTFRAADQFRTSIVYPNLNVKIVAHYGGLSDSYSGPTHQTVSDIAWVRALPNLCVVVPSDAVEVEKALRCISEYKGPVWLRLSRAPSPVIHGSNLEFRLGKANIMREGTDVALISTGTVLGRVMQAADELRRRGINPMVLSVPTIKPLDESALLYAARVTGAVVTCEEHNIAGGFGSAVCETLSSYNPVPVQRVGFADTFAESGDYDQLLDSYGLAVSDIIRAAETAISKKGKIGAPDKGVGR